jgi:hypothetical protein
MKNLIISLEKLPQEVKSHLENIYPHGFYHETVEFEMPGKSEIYEALRTTYNGINYMVKVSTRKKKVDFSIDGF